MHCFSHCLKLEPNLRIKLGLVEVSVRICISFFLSPFPMKASPEIGKDSQLESVRTDVSLMPSSTPLSLLPNTEEGEQLRRQKFSLLTQWEETRCED